MGVLVLRSLRCSFIRSSSQGEADQSFAGVFTSVLGFHAFLLRVQQCHCDFSDVNPKLVIKEKMVQWIC